MQTLIAERRMLEQRLEEAHMQLSDIKSTWSAQNLALETQVSRLSHQVAAETTEKRKALSSQDDQAERIKELQFELEKSGNEVTQRDNKVGPENHWQRITLAISPPTPLTFTLSLSHTAVY